MVPDDATQADLERVYAERGAAIVLCDLARQLAVDVHDGQSADVDAWLEAQQPKSLLKRLIP